MQTPALQDDVTAHAHILIITTAVPGIRRCGYLGCKHAGKVEMPPLAVESSDTSKAAARAIGTERSRLRNRVLEAIRAAGAQGATDEWLAEQLGMNPSTERPRRVELVSMGLVEDSKKTRLTKSGRSGTIWVALGR